MEKVESLPVQLLCVCVKLYECHGDGKRLPLFLTRPWGTLLCLLRLWKEVCLILLLSQPFLGLQRSSVCLRPWWFAQTSPALRELPLCLKRCF